MIGLLALSMLTPGDTDANIQPDPPADTLTGAFTISGDPLVTPLSRVWAAEFMALHPGRGHHRVQRRPAGLSVLSRGAAIYQSMPRLGDAGIETANGIQSNRIRIASDALSVIRWPWNPVDLLTVAQVSAIYSGKITNWKELGGNDAPILVYAMPPGH